MTAWQSQLTSFVEILPHLLETEEFADVTFIVDRPPNQKTFHIHKFLLAIRSDVFETMFYDTVPEIDEIKVPDIKNETFQVMLRYIYTEELELTTMEDSLKLYYAAHKYNVIHLINLCREYIDSELCPDNVCIVYDMAILLDVEELISKCEELITEFTAAVFESEAFNGMPYDTLLRVIKLKPLNFSHELILFEALLKWGNGELNRQHQDNSPQNLRDTLDPLLPYVEFLGMTNEDFLKGPALSGIFLKREIVSITMNISIPGCVPLPEWCSKERISQYFRIIQLYHKCTRGSLPFYLSPSVIECQLKIYGKDVIFKGLSFFAEYEIEPKSVFYINDRVYPLIPSKYVVHDQETNNMRLIMAEPFPMKEGNSYYIRVSLGCPVRFCRSSINSSITINTPEVKFVVDYADQRAFPKFFGEYYRGHFHEFFYRLVDLS